MSVDVRIYIGVYVKLEDLGVEIDVYDEKYEELIDDEKLIYDGMAGQYTYFGSTIKSFDEIYSFDAYELDELNISALKDEVSFELQKLLPELDCSRVTPQFIIFAHYH